MTRCFVRPWAVAAGSFAPRGATGIGNSLIQSEAYGAFAKDRPFWS